MSTQNDSPHYPTPYLDRPHTAGSGAGPTASQADIVRRVLFDNVEHLRDLRDESAGEQLKAEGLAHRHREEVEFIGRKIAALEVEIAGRAS